jgi:hypothetical protein
VVLNVLSGTIVDPLNGSYALGSSGTLSEGGPHKKAFVEPPGATIMFRAIAEGASFNGIEVNVADSGTNKLITVSDRLSAVKYRSSYFDLALTAEFDRVEELYGDRAVRRNKDLAANPELTSDGTAVSPYRPWSAGSISTGSNPHDFLIETGTNAPTVIVARVQAAGTNRELNLQSFTAAGVQVTQALEEVRAATRLPRRASAGFLIRDDVGYAAYEKETLLFTTNGTQANYVGTNSYAPASPYIAEIALEVGTIRSYATAAERPTDSNVYDYRAQGFSGSFNFQYGTWAFVLAPPSAGTEVFALWKPTSTEVVRTEPLPVTEKAYQARPEDQENGQIDEVADDIPWARELVVGGEQVDPTMYNPLVPDVTHELAEDVMSVPAQTGAEYNVYGINSLSGHLRFAFGQRTIGEDYKHGQPAIGYQGTLKDLAAIVPTPGQTELETFLSLEPSSSRSASSRASWWPTRIDSSAPRTGTTWWAGSR